MHILARGRDCNTNDSANRDTFVPVDQIGWAPLQRLFSHCNLENWLFSKIDVPFCGRCPEKLGARSYLNFKLFELLHPLLWITTDIFGLR